jgi:hypothetical protein
MWHLYEMLAREHMNDLLREVEYDGYSRTARGARGRSNGLYGPAMVWLGHWLVAWGWRLRARHSAIEFREDAGAAHRHSR